MGNAKWPQYWGDKFKTHTSNGDEKKQGRNGGSERKIENWKKKRKYNTENRAEEKLGVSCCNLTQHGNLCFYK